MSQGTSSVCREAPLIFTIIICIDEKKVCLIEDIVNDWEDFAFIFLHILWLFYFILRSMKKILKHSAVLNDKFCQPS